MPEKKVNERGGNSYKGSTSERKMENGELGEIQGFGTLRVLESGTCIGADRVLRYSGIQPLGLDFLRWRGLHH